MKAKKNIKIIETLAKNDIELHLEREVFQKGKSEMTEVYHIRPVVKPFHSVQFI